MAVAITEESPARLSRLQPLWHRSAPRRLAARCPDHDPVAGWTAWQKHLGRRKRPELPPFLAASGRKQPPLLWGWQNDWEQLCANSSDGNRIDTDRILAALFVKPGLGRVIDLEEAMQSVALAYALPGLVCEIPGDAWWKLVERLHDLATQAQQIRVDWPADPRDVLRHQLLAGEMPLAISYLFPELQALRALRDPARHTLSEAIVELTDGQGLPHARLLPVLGALFALWTRARWIGKRLKGGSWSADAEVQYEWLVRHALRLVDADGRLMFTSGDEGEPQPWVADLFKAALALVGESDQCAIASAVLPGRVVPKHVKFDDGDLPEPSLESDWSGIGVLASGWSRSATRLAIAFAEDPVRIELTLGKAKLFVGDWAHITSCDGEQVRAIGEWEELCWQTGKRYDLLELRMDLTGGLRLERQLLLARDDQILYLADIVIGPDGAARQLRHSVRLPLGPESDWEPEADTRDGVLVTGERRTAVLPLGLHEWRCDPRGGALVEEAGNLVLTQDSNGTALYCPLLLDLKSRRSKHNRTWRQLTVAESLEIVPRDLAVGFRAQSGRDQWLFYRSLGRPGNRSVLGLNVAGEFTAGRFLANGKLKSWIEIEAE